MIVNIPAIEVFFINSCFSFLFVTTVYYWFQLSFSKKSEYNQTGLLGYGAATFCLTLQLVLRWVDSGHFPLSNLYESLIFLAWCFLILHIYIETSLKTIFLGVLTSPAILCLVAFTDFSLPPELQRSSPLVPALQSNWLMMHVTVMIASYAALLLGCLVSIAYLIFSKINTKKTFINFSQDFQIVSLKNKTGPFSKVSFDTQTSGFTNTKEIKLFQDGENFLKNETKSKNFLFFLDNLSYRTIGIGFCFLTLGILSGAVWANETWGSYWSWDPKETWAFITWLTFAFYLHSRLIGGWSGSKPAWVACFGFIIVWVCYLGVNLLGQGLHSYGFLKI